MKKIYLIVCLLSYTVTIKAQTALSPDQFLGYKIGTHFTPHYKIINYFRSVAEARPDIVKFEKYGETSEGRDLILTYIALPENLKKLDDIRKNNLRLAGIIKDGTQPQTNMPAIVWLSYNVHGNEPASSEAAMLTLYALIDNNNTQIQEGLKNVVVIIDPCINPDGRERYVNWYNDVVGEQYNVDPQAREHTEPWPRGRTNHYYFDLNRDWAWQTQPETQQRMKKYNEWLPQVHVDYHEQGYNEPYYFAPAAEPYHEVITQWQKDFQVMIGKNNAKYFDKNGWLYFTKERFDLFYPSYGDTYPLYNGAIGMTFEQGGIGAGLGIIKEDGDTLTLTDRALHHYTTGISTIETASKNATKLVTEFKKFYDDAQNATDASYKTYVLTAKNKEELSEVVQLLKSNDIQFGTTNAKTFKGYNYFNGKEETFISKGYQLAIPAFQSKGTLVKVLFEPRSVLTDSNTYDITAWAIPYVYNVQAYAVKDKLDISVYDTTFSIKNVEADYGILIPYTSFASSKVLAYLLSHKVKVRFAQKPFTYNDKNYDRGTLIILKANNISNWSKMTNEACTKFDVQHYAVESGFMEKGADFGSPDIHFIHELKVAMITGNQVSSTAAGEVWYYFEKRLNYPLTQILADDLRRSDLNDYDVLIFPDGSYKAFTDKNISAQLEEFVRNGGKIISMENAVSDMSDNDWGIKTKTEDEDLKTDSNYALLKAYGNREREDISETIPGAIYKVDLDTTHPLAFGYPEHYYTLKQDKNVYEFLKDGWNAGVIKQSNYVSGFVGSKVKPKIKDGVVFGVKDFGKGTVVYLADDPLFRAFWRGGEMLFANAVFLVGE